MLFEKRETKCGAPLYVFEMPHAQSVASGILVKVGSVDEKWPEEAGLAHAFEHMVFQGNERLKNSLELSAYIEEIGGSNNAWTSKEMTFFHAIVPKDDYARGFMWLYHLLSSPSFSEKNIKTEMQNVIQEIKRRNDDPAQLSGDLFVEVVYEGHPLGKDTLGLVESVGSFTRDHFLAYYERFYCAQNFVFIVVGNVRTEEVLKLINTYAWRDKNSSPVVCPALTARHRKQVKVVEKSDIEQVHALVGTLIGPAREKSTKALQLFDVMIDGGMSFPLFQEVRDKRGLCYVVSSSITPWTERGFFSVYVGTDPTKYREALQIIKQVIRESASDEKLFERAKKLLRGRVALRYEHPNSILGSAAMSTIFHGKPLSPEEAMQEIESVTFEEVQSACAQYLVLENFTEVYVAPKGFILEK